jgi:hypothetical protein
MTVLNAAIQMQTPDDLRGRVMSLYTWCAAGMPALGGWLLGRLLTSTAPDATLLMTGGSLIMLAVGISAIGMPDSGSRAGKLLG